MEAAGYVISELVRKSFETARGCMRRKLGLMKILSHAGVSR